MTAVVPLRFGGRVLLAALFAFARIARRFFFREVQEMTLVYAMQWSVLRPFARFGTGNERKPHLLFETNFTGGWAEYIEGFARAVPVGMSLLFGRTVGYPGLFGNVNAFVEFVGRHDMVADYYYAAYTAEPLEIEKALLLRRIGAPGPSPGDEDPLLDEPEFTADGRITVRRGWLITSPNQIEVVLPIRPGRGARVRNALDRRDALHRAFCGASRIHFARFLVLDFPSGSYLLFTATYDTGERFRGSTRPSRRPDLPKDVDVVLAELVEAAARPPQRGAPYDDPLRNVLCHCVDYPTPIGDPARDLSALTDYLLAHQRPHGPLSQLPYCAYPDASLVDVRAALDLYYPT